MKQRIITALVGCAFVVVWLAFRDTVVFNIVIAIAIVMAMFEALHATKMVTNKPLLAVSVLFSAVVPFFQLFRYFPVGIALTFLFIVALFVISLSQHRKIKLSQVSYVFMMSVIIPFAMSSLLYINSVSNYNKSYDKLDGFLFVLLALLGAWIADTGAYFAGRFFGKHKLAPIISPKKTIEGAVGGVIAVLIVYAVVGIVWQFCVIKDSESINFVWLLLLGLITSVAGMLGDLSFSFIKRETGIKDYGNIMPGHGGLLDRVDSVMLTAPLTLMYIQFVPIVVHL